MVDNPLQSQLRTDHTSNLKIANFLLLDDDENIDIDNLNEILHDFDDYTPSTNKLHDTQAFIRRIPYKLRESFYSSH